jgi:hypothetical protein
MVSKSSYGRLQINALEVAIYVDYHITCGEALEQFLQTLDKFKISKA